MTRCSPLIMFCHCRLKEFRPDQVVYLRPFFLFLLCCHGVAPSNLCSQLIVVWRELEGACPSSKMSSRNAHPALYVMTPRAFRRVPTGQTGWLCPHSWHCLISVIHIWQVTASVPQLYFQSRKSVCHFENVPSVTQLLKAPTNLLRSIAIVKTKSYFL